MSTLGANRGGVDEYLAVDRADVDLCSRTDQSGADGVLNTVDAEVTREVVESAGRYYQQRPLVFEGHGGGGVHRSVASGDTQHRAALDGLGQGDMSLAFEDLCPHAANGQPGRILHPDQNCCGPANALLWGTGFKPTRSG